MKKLSAIVLLTLLPVLAARAEVEMVPTLSVQGQATIKVPADQVEFRIGVETSADTAERALALNSRLMADVRKKLAADGLEKRELETGGFSIQPQWAPRPHKAASDWKPLIVGYVVSNSLEISSVKLDRVGDWISTATEAGANKIGQLRFSLQQPDRHRDQAIRLATQKAMGYARAAADAAQVTLSGIAAIQVDHANIRPMMRAQPVMEMKMLSADSAIAPPVTAGEIEVQASVRLSYRLQP